MYVNTADATVRNINAIYKLRPGDQLSHQLMRLLSQWDAISHADQRRLYYACAAYRTYLLGGPS